MPTKTPRYWKKLERHPLSAEYDDVPEAVMEQMVADIKEHGVINGRKVTLYEDKVLDGWQIYTACLKAGHKPDFTYVPRHLTAEQFVRIVNDNRRHESAEAAARRVKQRRERVVAARAEGKSTTQIAEEEGVSQPTIVRDLQAAGYTPEYPEKVTGKDGKTYSTRKAEREPGDDSADEKAEAELPRNGKVIFDRKPFDEAWGALLRQIDKLGKGYKAKDTPAAEGLRRMLQEFKTSFFQWHKDLKAAAK